MPGHDTLTSTNDWTQRKLHLLVFSLGEQNSLVAVVFHLQQATLGQHLWEHEGWTSHEDLHLFIAQTVDFICCKHNTGHVFQLRHSYISTPALQRGWGQVHLTVCR